MKSEEEEEEEEEEKEKLSIYNKNIKLIKIANEASYNIFLKSCGHNYQINFLQNLPKKIETKEYKDTNDKIKIKKSNDSDKEENNINKNNINFDKKKSCENYNVIEKEVNSNDSDSNVIQKKDVYIISEKKNNNSDEIGHKQHKNVKQKGKVHERSKTYMEHIYRLRIKRSIMNNTIKYNDGFYLNNYDNIFKNYQIEIINKALDVTKDLFTKVPSPLNNMTDCYIKINKLLSFKFSTKRELTDAEDLCRILFMFLINCRTNMHIDSNYCCQQLNKQPITFIPDTNLPLSNFIEHYRHKTEADLMIISNFLDYQWASIEYLILILFNNYLEFRKRNSHIYPFSFY